MKDSTSIRINSLFRGFGSTGVGVVISLSILSIKQNFRVDDILTFFVIWFICGIVSSVAFLFINPHIKQILYTPADPDGQDDAN